MTDDRAKDVERVLDQMRPLIQADGGGITLVDISLDGVVTVRLEGNCVGCGSQSVTVDEGIRSVVVSQLDWATDVVAVEGEGKADTGPSITAKMEADYSSTEDLLVDLDTELLDLNTGDEMPAIVKHWLEHAGSRLPVLMKLEEDCVFPVLRDFLNTAAGPVGIMIAEHKDFFRLNEEFELAANEYDASNEKTLENLKKTGRAVTRHLSAHLIKERSSVFHLLDGALPEDLRTEVIQDLNRFEAAQRISPMAKEKASS
ncbi:MAG: NifU family protein [Planctomycetota bacterium]|jgi:Fe-S cluster biogenesis protein NfuA/iron-sulfur cluster repair protein YtfE (RIC family)